MLVLIILLFLLCWGPRLILNVLIKLGLPMYSHWIYNTRIVFHVLSFVHSAVNPFVYGQSIESSVIADTLPLIMFLTTLF